MTIAIGVLGAAGAMGRQVCAAIGEGMRLEAAVVRPGSSWEGCPVPGQEGARFVPLAAGVFDGCDVVVDFSLPDGLQAALPLLGPIALVTGTTGLGIAQQAALEAHASKAPLLQAANFSVGVNVLLELVQLASAAMPEADIELVELHHRRKRDAPSGTALALVEAVRRARPALEVGHGRSGATGSRGPDELGVHAVRGGDVVGDHTVWFLADGERMSLTHMATERKTFALGALRCVRWIVGRPHGSYTMRDVLGLGALDER
jgi:4-hydroxy-tetrahydrodipicolinate reductase